MPWSGVIPDRLNVAKVVRLPDIRGEPGPQLGACPGEWLALAAFL